MRKSLLVTLLSGLLVCVFALPALYAVEAPADMELTVPEGAKATKTPVMFSHEQHKAYECQVCHHKWDGSSEIKGCAADGCHTDMKAKRGDSSFYAAFHDRKAEASCVGCHSKEKKAGAKNVPTACTQCHPK